MTLPDQRTRAEFEATFRRLCDEADKLGLRASPPYSDGRVRAAFIAGYDAALSDIAQGKVRP